MRSTFVFSPLPSVLTAALLLASVSACNEPKATTPAPAAATATPKTATAAEPAPAPVCQGAGCAPGDPLAPLPGAATTATALNLDGTKYGGGVTLAENSSVAEILAHPDAWAGKRVRVEGEVTDVCQMAGCWMEVKSADAPKPIKFKVTDGVITFPKDSAGKHAVAEGTVRLIPLTLAQTRKVKAHEAEEQGKPFDPNTVTAAETLVRLDGIGAVLSDKK